MATDCTALRPSCIPPPMVDSRAWSSRRPTLWVAAPQRRSRQHSACACRGVRETCRAARKRIPEPPARCGTGQRCRGGHHQPRPSIIVGSLATRRVPNPNSAIGAIRLIAAMAVDDWPTAVAGNVRAATAQKANPSAEVTTEVEARLAALRSRKRSLLDRSGSGPLPPPPFGHRARLPTWPPARRSTAAIASCPAGRPCWHHVDGPRVGQNLIHPEVVFGQRNPYRGSMNGTAMSPADAPPAAELCGVRV